VTETKSPKTISELIARETHLLALAHEIGHAVQALRLGYNVVIQHQPGQPLTDWQTVTVEADNYLPDYALSSACLVWYK
jgi:hypothetical protein